MFVLELFTLLGSERKKEGQQYCFETEYDGYNIEAVHTQIPRCEANAIWLMLNFSDSFCCLLKPQS